MGNIDQAKWYVIHTYATYENMVETNLHKMIDNNNLGEEIFDIVIPVEDDIVERNGKKKVIQRKKFPGYVFLKMIYTNHVWYMVTNTRGVTGFVGPQGHPLPLTPEEVKRMGLEIIKLEDFDIAVGDQIKVINGALDGFMGEVTNISAEKQTVKVNVSMFGRLTPVELEFSQVEKI